jgi:uncharacterized ubiquitin-like protein YukD
VFWRVSAVKKLTFERAILIVLIMILFISTTEVRGRYIEIIKDRFTYKASPASSDILTDKSSGFPTMMRAADNLYKQEDYVKAAEGYLALSINNALSTDQRAHANFRLGACQYNMKNYQLAFESFVKAASLNATDSVTYNNAAVSAYRANDMKMAIEYEEKALKLLPAVEYYYNLARMYEDNEQYDLAINNYIAVAKAEQNLTETSKIDPVRVKEKIARLMSNKQSPLTGNMVIGLKIKNPADEVLTINENEMQIKSGDFAVKVEEGKGKKNIIAEYDRNKFDPYNLISEIHWIIYRNGEPLYKKDSDKIVYNATESGNYNIQLSIKYAGNNEKLLKRIVTIRDDKSSISTTYQEDTITRPRPTVDRTYEYAMYEQLFEQDFNISGRSYIDKYDVTWGSDGIKSELYSNIRIDKSTSLLITNNLKDNSGIWINFDKLLDEKDIKGKTLNIRYYVRSMSKNAVLIITTRTKTNNIISSSLENFIIQDKWEQKTSSIYIPDDATGFTFTIKTRPGDQFLIDGFIIMD